jgi:hypothetical protein
MGRPEEIASAALFLASDDSSFVNGVELLSTAASRPSESIGNQKSALRVESNDFHQGISYSRNARLRGP